MKNNCNLKNKVLLLLLLAVAGLVKAQNFHDKEQIWESLPLENTAWVHFYQSMMTDSMYFQLGIKGDTIVNDMVYHKLIDCTHIGFPIEGECFGGIRNDGEGKYYFLSFTINHPEPWPLQLICEESGTDTEYLIYDFSLSECDVFPYDGDEYLADYPESVFEIEEIMINGNMRKTLWFDDDCENGEHYHDHNWIEGIGSNQGLLYSIQLIPMNGSQYHLVEILQDGEAVYTDPEFEGVDYTWIQETYLSPVSLYPNPITETGVLDFSKAEGVENLVIMALDGRIVKSENIKGLSSVIMKKEELGVGLFIYLLSGKRNNIITGKICIID